MNYPSIWIGFDPREAAAFAVARQSVRRFCNAPIPIRALILDDLRRKGLYRRPTEVRPSAADRPVLWDVISDAPMSTEFANSRFLVPHLAKRGWALFMDCDMLVLRDLSPLFNILDESKALYCVKHQYAPSNSPKMDGQVQTSYQRKNWSSFMLFNCDHPANKTLTPDVVNEMPGRELHRFFWLADSDIGELGAGYNWLVGEQPEPEDLKVVHYTLGGPWFNGFENAPYSAEWRKELETWAAK